MYEVWRKLKESVLIKYNRMVVGLTSKKHVVYNKYMFLTFRGEFKDYFFLPLTNKSSENIPFTIMVPDSSNASEQNDFEIERLFLPKASQSHFYWHFCIFLFSYTDNNIARIPTQTACDFQQACKQGHLLNRRTRLLRRFYHLYVNHSQKSVNWTDEVLYTFFENYMNGF